MGGTRVESFSYKPSSFSSINHYGNYSFGQVLLSYEKARRHVKESQVRPSTQRLGHKVQQVYEWLQAI